MKTTFSILKYHIVISAFFLVTWFAVDATADRILLKNGGELSGIVDEEPEKNRYRVEVDGGAIWVQKSRVKEVVYEDNALKTFRERRKQVDASDPEALYELATWAENHELYSKSRELYREIIRLAPDHEGARKALGYQKYEGEWLTEDEYMRAKGYVKYEGEWVTPEVKQAREEMKRREERRRQQEKLEEQERQLEEAQEEIERLKEEQRERDRYRSPYAIPRVRIIPLHKRSLRHHRRFRRRRGRHFRNPLDQRRVIPPDRPRFRERPGRGRFRHHRDD